MRRLTPHRHDDTLNLVLDGYSILQAGVLKMYKAVLVGTGGWAAAHAEAYLICENIQLAGICGHSNMDRLKEMAHRYDIPDYSLDLRSLLLATQPDILDVSANPHFRLQAVQEAVRHESIKLINLEKPMALMPEDAYEIAELCKRYNKLLTINHQKKFLPAWQKAYSLIASGALGELRHIRATCRGNVLEQGTHLLDMALHFNQYEPIEWVMGQIGALDGLDKEGASAPDEAAAVLHARNGVRIYMECGAVGRTISAKDNKWLQFSLEAYGTEGHLNIGLNQTLAFTRYADGSTHVEESSWDLHYRDAQARHLRSLADYIQNPAAGHISDLERSLSSFEIVMAIYASGVQSGRIALPRKFSNQLMEEMSAKRTN